MGNINLHEIEAFLSVAKHQNISKAAAELYVSQPSLSKWINKMEETCGTQLFTRTNRGVTLTPEGEVLYARLDIAYNRFRVSVEEICSPEVPSLNTLRIGCINRKSASDITNERVREFSALHPELTVKFEKFNFYELRDKLLCDELDLAITLSPDVENRQEFDYRELCPYPLYFVVPGNWSKGACEDDIISRLDGNKLIIEAPTQRAGAEAVCKDYGITPSAVKYVNSYILLTTLVAREAGFGVFGQMELEKSYVPDVVYIPVKRKHTVSVAAAWKNGCLSDAARLFVEHFSNSTNK